MSVRKRSKFHLRQDTCLWCWQNRILSCVKCWTVQPTGVCCLHACEHPLCTECEPVAPHTSCAVYPQMNAVTQWNTCHLHGVWRATRRQRDTSWFDEASEVTGVLLSADRPQTRPTHIPASSLPLVTVHWSTLLRHIELWVPVAPVLTQVLATSSLPYTCPDSGSCNFLCPLHLSWLRFLQLPLSLTPLLTQVLATSSVPYTSPDSGSCNFLCPSHQMLEYCVKTGDGGVLSVSFSSHNLLIII
jgi:hypothetical protein